MSIVRRDFVKIGAAGMAAAFLPSPIAFGQDASAEKKPGTTVSEFRGGSGSLYLEGRIAGGLLKLRVDDFIQAHGSGDDRALVAQGTFEANNAKPVRLYRSYFCCSDGREIFFRLEDENASSTLVFSGADDPNVEYLTAWSDTSSPQQFKIDIKKFSESRDPQASIVSGNAARLDEAQVGKRKPPPITQEEFENAFANTAAFLEFNRGKRVFRQHAVMQAVGCSWAATVKGAGMIGPLWEV